MFQKNVVKITYVDMLLIGEREKKYYVLIRDFNTFMYGYILNRGKKHFCHYHLHAFSKEELFKVIKVIQSYCFKTNCKQRIKIPKKGEYVRFKNYERKIKSPFMIYTDFESVLVPEDNGKQILDEYYTNKYQKHVACGYGYKLV